MSYVAIPLAGEAISDPVKWNDDWEVILQAPGLTPAFCFDTALVQNKTLPIPLDNLLREYQMNLSGTCAVQRTLTLEAERFLKLEHRWLAASPEVRRKHLLAALAGVCSSSANLNQARLYCAKELRLELLSSDGHAFFDLMRSAMLADPSVIPREPKYISDPAWDAFSPKTSTDLEKVSWAGILMLRTKLICYVLSHTIRVFLDIEPHPIVVNKDKSNKLTKAQTRPIVSQADQLNETIFGREAARERKKADKSSIKERHNLRVVRCSYCDNTEPDDGSVKFKHCARCLEKLDRRVVYCSPECQKGDWKLQHKAVCGKELSFEDVATLPDNPRNEVLRAQAGSANQRAANVAPISDNPIEQLNEIIRSGNQELLGNIFGFRRRG